MLLCLYCLTVTLWLYGQDTAGHDTWFSLEIVLGWTIRKNWMEYFEQNRTIEVDS